MTARPQPRPLMLGMGWFPYEAGGLSRYYRGLFEALSAAGAEPRAVVLGPAPHVPDHARVAGSADEPVLRRIRAFAAAARELGRSADLVDTHFALYSVVPVRMGSLRRKPLVLHFHGPWAAEGAAIGGHSRIRVAAKRLVERSLYRRADRAVVLSASSKRTLVEEYGLSPWDVEIVRPGVDLDRFKPGDRSEARARLGLPADAFVGVAVRRLVPRMGIDVLIDAWARLPADDRVVLLIGGVGPERDALEERADRLGIGDRVRFLGAVSDDELVACYGAADVCVVPSRELEGFGLVVLEALACGTPPLVSDVGGLPEAVVDLDPSLVVPVGDASSLAERLRGARDGTLPLPSAERCVRHARAFSWQNAAARHLEIYRRAVAQEERESGRLRVVYLDHCARLSGAELALLRVLPRLPEVDAHVILAEDGPLVPRLLRLGVSVEVLPLSERARGAARGAARGRALATPAGVATALHVLRLARRLRKLRPDLVHTNSLKAALYGGLAARLAGVPVVWHLHDRIADDYLPATAVRIVGLAARLLPDAVIANSLATAATIPRTDVHVVANPVDTGEAPGRQRREPPLRVGIVGRIAPWKGQDVALRAFAEAFPRGRERLAVVGAPLFGEDEESYAESLRTLSDRLGLDGRVEFRGFCDDVTAELERMDVLVHASVLPEPFGQVVLEGMAAGVPVVASAAGGPAEIVEDRVTGLLYPPGDVAALATALDRLATDGALRRRLGEAGRERARSYAPETAAARVREIYEEVSRRR